MTTMIAALEVIQGCTRLILASTIQNGDARSPWVVLMDFPANIGNMTNFMVVR